MFVYGRGVLAGAILVMFLIGCGTNAEPLRRRVVRDDPDNESSHAAAAADGDASTTTEPPKPELDDKADGGASQVVVDDNGSSTVSPIVETKLPDATELTTHKSDEQQGNGTVDNATQEADNTTDKAPAATPQGAVATHIVPIAKQDIDDNPNNGSTINTGATGGQATTAGSGPAGNTTSSVPLPVQAQAGVYLTIASTLLVAAVV
jgi:hypothetical protein